MNKRKSIYLNEPLMRAAEEAKNYDGGFSRRLGEIVGRYYILLDLEPIPELSQEELSIISGIASKDFVNSRMVQALHIDVQYSPAGSDEERQELSKKIEPLTPGQRLALIEMACSKNGE